MSKVLNRRGIPQATLVRNPLKLKVIKLDRPESTVVCNASMPNAPQGFSWPWLKTPARFV